MIGIYAIFRKEDDVCLYVGQSINVEHRVSQHFNMRHSHIDLHGGKKKYYFKIVETLYDKDREVLRDHEAYWINKLDPLLNKQKPGLLVFVRQKPT